MLGLGLKQGALDMKSYAPTLLPCGRRGALSQTQPGHAVFTPHLSPYSESLQCTQHYMIEWHY